MSRNIPEYNMAIKQVLLFKKTFLTGSVPKYDMANKTGMALQNDHPVIFDQVS